VALTSHGARTARGTLDVRSHVPEPIQVLVPLARVNVLLGTSLSGDQVASLLEPMGFGAEPTHGTVLVTVPTNRPDIRPAPHGIADITEEIGRAYGYARLDRRQPAWPAVGGLTERQRQRRLLRQVLAGLGASEAWTPTFVSDEDHRLIGLEGPAIRVANSSQLKRRGCDDRSCRGSSTHSPTTRTAGKRAFGSSRSARCSRTRT